MSTVLELRQPQSLAEIAAANIRAEVARAGVTQRDLARALGMSQPACSDRFRGKTPWTLNELEAVARLLGTTASELVRHQGLEPRTRWFGASIAPVISLAAHRRARRPLAVVAS